MLGKNSKQFWISYVVTKTFFGGIMINIKVMKSASVFCV